MVFSNPRFGVFFCKSKDFENEMPVYEGVVLMYDGMEMERKKEMYNETVKPKGQSKLAYAYVLL